MPEETELKKQARKSEPVDFRELDETVIRIVRDDAASSDESAPQPEGAPLQSKGDMQLDTAAPVEQILPIEGMGKALLGTTLKGGILIKSMIGSGGMSSVYRGFQQTLNREVAVKVMHSHLLSEDNAMKRFNQEAHAAARLDHQNIVKVHDFQADDSGKAFLVMDLVKGISLSDAIDQAGWLDAENAVDIFSQACDALHHAHTKGVVHRDLKPSNIMLLKNDTGSDTVKILDFGIAKILPQQGDQRTKLTQTGEVFGSPLYMSPEQCMGKDIDLRSDIYSMGCLIYESLTGHPPLEGANAFDTFFKHTTEKPPSIKQYRSNLENMREFDAIILKAMAKDPRERYQSMLELKADLQRLGKDDKNWIGKVGDDVEMMRRGMSARKKISTPQMVLGGGLVIATLVAVGLFIKLSEPPKVEAGSAAWNQLYQTAQQDFDKGKYAEARKEFELALKSAGMDKALTVPVLRELTDLDHVVGGSKESPYDVQLQAAEDEKEKPIQERITALTNKFVETSRKSGPDVDDQLHMIVMDLNDQINQVSKFSLKSRELSRNSLMTVISTLEERKDTNNDSYARSLHNYAWNLMGMRKYKESLAAFEKALPARKQRADADPANLRGYLHTMQWLANAYELNGDRNNAEKYLQQRLAVSRKVGAKGAAATNHNNPFVAESKFLLAEFYLYSKGDLEQARANADGAITIYENLDVVEPREQADCYTLLGVINSRAGKLQEAERNFEQARKIYESLLQKETGYWVQALVGLGDIKVGRKDYAGAEPYFRRALAVAQRSTLRHPEYIDFCFAKLTQIVENRGSGPEQLNELLQLGNHRLAYDIKRQGANSEAVVRDYVSLAETSRRLNHLDEAMNYLEKAIAVNENLEQKDSWLLVHLLHSMGRLQFDNQNPMVGRKSFEDAVSLAERLKDVPGQDKKQIIAALQFDVNSRMKDAPELIKRAAQMTK